MAASYKVLGQVAPSATTLSSLYTVPSATEAVISTITVCNRGATSGTYRLAVRPNGVSVSSEHYLVYDATCGANDTVTFTMGITLDASDVLSVYASSADFSFNAFGSELT